MVGLQATFVVCVALACACTAHYGDPATQEDYAHVLGIERIGILPWQHISNPKPPYRILTPQQLQALGQQHFLGRIPSGQNATTLAEVLYDWSQPDYRRMNFVLTVPNNVSGLSEMIDYWPINHMPFVPEMFNLTGSTTAENDMQLRNNYDAVVDFSTAQTNVIDYALYSLPAADYNAPGIPQVLYRGGGRNVDFYCNQFEGGTYGTSFDDCVNQMFQPGSTTQVNPFWSTTPDPKVIAHFRGLVQYNILPNTDTREHWLARKIDMFSCETSALEYLYPHGSSFKVVNATCDTSTSSAFWMIFLKEVAVLNVTSTVEDTPHIAMPSQCVSTTKGTRRAVADVPEHMHRFFD